MRLSINELTTFRWEFEEDVFEYAEAGFDGIGVWREKLTDYGCEAGIDLLREVGLPVSSLMWCGGFTGSEGRSHREAIDDGIEALHLAASLGAESLVTYTGSRGGHTHKHSRRLVVTALSELANVADELDVQLAIEPMHPGCGHDWTFINTLHEAVELLSELDFNESAKIVYDAYHMGLQTVDLAFLEQIVPLIGLVQLGNARETPYGEQDRCVLREGIVPIREIIETINDAGYDGFYEVELIGQEIEELDKYQLLSESRNAFDYLTAGMSSRQTKRSLPRT